MRQPKLETRVKKIIEVDGLKFKDLNGNGKLDPYEDWRLSPEERAKDLISQMDLDDKCGMMMITTQQMGQSTDKENTSKDGVLNDEYKDSKSSIFATQKEYGNTRTIEELRMRHFILRENYSEREIATWINAMNEVAEGTRLGIPVLIASNSRNENAERTFGMNDAVGVFSCWPSTLGIAASALGDKKKGLGTGVFTEFAETAREEWAKTGIRKGYMYMVDTVTDPRWQRIYGTFGEDVDLISDACGQLIDGFQGKELGEDSVALTIKHFPGGGARENGFDPHYKEGKFNVYQTPGSLEKYHLPPFKIAAEHGASSIMPYYSIPSDEKSEEQTYNGEKIPFEQRGFAFNKYFLKDILRDEFGFKGYINSDSGILDQMCWGVEDMEQVDRCALAINSGVDIIADTNEVFHIKDAYNQGKISMERLDQANERLLIEMFKLGLFDEKTYVDPDEAEKVVSSKEKLDKAYECHQKSLVLLKNKDDLLPLKAGTKIYVEGFHKEEERSEAYNQEVRKPFKESSDLVLVDKVEDADVCLVMLYPKSGNYFSATPGLLELALCENKVNKAVDGSEYQETTIYNYSRVKDLQDKIHEKGGKFIVSINCVLPWLLDTVEPDSDAVIAHFETFTEAQIDVITGKVSPSGLLPISLPKNEEVISVDEDGKCLSPNDVPGYDKDKYMPDGMTYSYVDTEGNEYKSGFGLTY